MKKVLLVVSLVCVFLLTGCNNEKKVENNNENSFNQDNHAISVEDLIGTFSWNKNYINDYANELNLKVELVLKSDGSAEYSASDGYVAEETRGSFEYKDGKIIYTREYFNYQGANGQTEDSKFDGGDSAVIFNVIDKDTLQSIYRDQTVTLKNN